MHRIAFLLCIITLSSVSYANSVSNEIDQLISHKSGASQKRSFGESTIEAKRDKNDFDQINQKYAFVLFYRASCPHCQRFVPKVKQFSDEYGFHVYPSSVQGQSLPSFPNSMPITQQIASTFFSSPNFVVPSLYLINTKTMKAFLIDQGEESYLDLYTQMSQFLHQGHSDDI